MISTFCVVRMCNGARGRTEHGPSSLHASSAHRPFTTERRLEWVRLPFQSHATISINKHLSCFYVSATRDYDEWGRAVCSQMQWEPGEGESLLLFYGTLMMMEDKYFKSANRENFSVQNIKYNAAIINTLITLAESLFIICMYWNATLNLTNR